MGGFYFPPSKHPVLAVTGNLLLGAAFGESQPCGKTCRAMPHPVTGGIPWTPPAISRQG